VLVVVAVVVVVVVTDRGGGTRDTARGGVDTDGALATR